MITPHIRKITAIDFYNYTKEHFYDPIRGEKTSLYISINTLMGLNNDKFDTWECQIHLIEKDKFDKSKIDGIRNKLNKEKRLNILEIKYWANKVNKVLIGKSNGHFKIYSPSIYEAVLDNHASNVDEFIKIFKSTVPLQYQDIFSETINLIGGE